MSFKKHPPRRTFERKKERMEKRALLVRFSSGEKQTLSQLLVFTGDILALQIVGLELAWRNNERGVSCIPPGDYVLRPFDSPTHGKVYRIGTKDSPDVPGRQYCLIHPANFHYQLRGCIATGMTHSDINGDMLKDTVDSRTAMNRLRNVIGAIEIPFKVIDI